MPNFEAKGELIKISDTDKISDRFQKREFVLKIEEKYPQEIQYQLTQDDCSILDNFKVGDQVKVNSWVRGRRWQKTPQDDPRWFNSLVAYKIEGESVTPFIDDSKDMASAEIAPPSEDDALPF